MPRAGPRITTDTFLVHDDPRMYGYGIGFALLVGLLASAIPAARAARVEPVDVLRGQLGWTPRRA